MRLLPIGIVARWSGTFAGGGVLFSLVISLELLQRLSWLLTDEHRHVSRVVKVHVVQLLQVLVLDGDFVTGHGSQHVSGLIVAALPPLSEDWRSTVLKVQR